MRLTVLERIDRITEELSHYAGEFNLIAIVSHTIINSVRRNQAATLSTLISLSI